MEGFSRMLNIANYNAWIKVFKVGDSIEVSHLLYADDTLILCDADIH